MSDDQDEESVLETLARMVLTFFGALILAGFLVFGLCTLVMGG